MEYINFLDEPISVEKYIAIRVCSNNGAKSKVFKEDLQVECERCDIELTGKETKKDLFELLMNTGLSIFDVAERFHIGVSSFELQRTFDITHKDIKRLERLGVLKVVGQSSFRAFGKTRYAPEYSLEQYYKWNAEDMKNLLAQYPKGCRKRIAEIEDGTADLQEHELIMDKDKCHRLYSFSVYPGWWDILDKYIPQVLAIDPNAELYIKEKFGVLRLKAVSEKHDWREFFEIETSAEVASSTVCEFCGAPGKLRTDRPWIQTLCDRCSAVTDDNIKKQIMDETEKKWLDKA